MQSTPDGTLEDIEFPVRWTLYYGWASNRVYNRYVYADRNGQEYHCCDVSTEPSSWHADCTLLFHKEVRWVKTLELPSRGLHTVDGMHVLTHLLTIDLDVLAHMHTTDSISTGMRFDFFTVHHKFYVRVGTKNYHIRPSRIAPRRFSPYRGVIAVDRYTLLAWTPQQILLRQNRSSLHNCVHNDGALWAALQKAKDNLRSFGRPVVADRQPSIPRIMLHPGRNYLTVADYVAIEQCMRSGVEVLSLIGGHLTLNHLRHLLGHSLKINRAIPVAN